MTRKQGILLLTVLLGTALCAGAAEPLKVHGIFRSNMVIQRDKPTTIWGWAPAGKTVRVAFGERSAEGTAKGDDGRWEVTFEPQAANGAGQTITVVCGDETIEMDNVVIGDIWVMNGQSNMAFGLKAVYRADLESATAHLPLLRHIRINAGAESEHLEKDLDDRFINGRDEDKNWRVVAPEAAMSMGAIGYVFGSRLQRSLQIPIGIIDNARGGASIESLVPRRKFKDHSLAARYLAWVEKRQAEFDWDAAVQKIVDKWEKKVAALRKKGVAAEKLPPRPTRADLRSWSIPGRSPSDAASCYNGMFGVFKGLNITGVLFHQGYNNAMSSACRPRRYRVLMKLMVEGWREDFNDPHLPVGVIGFCAGGIPQTRENFEIWSVSGGAYIREAQRRGLADVKDPEHTAFLPAYDVQIPGLHPKKKQAHGVRAARWALSRVYGMKIEWNTASLVSAEREGDCMVLTFDKKVMPDDMSMVPRGFSIADDSGKFYMAHARFLEKKDVGIWNTANKSADAVKIYVWSPLVKQPAAVRYAWATSPMGNLKVDGKPWQPLHGFRTDAWDWPESEDPAETVVTRGRSREMKKEAAARCAYRKSEEAKRAVEILDRLENLGCCSSCSRAREVMVSPCSLYTIVRRR